MINPELLNIPPLEFVLRYGRNGPTDEDKLAMLLALHGQSADTFRQVMLALLGSNRQLHASVEVANSHIRKAQEAIDKLTAPPLLPAIFMRAVEARNARRAEVKMGSARRVVEIAPEVILANLAKGQEVYLAHEANVILATATHTLPPPGEVAEFVRWLDQHFVVIRWRDEDLVVEAAASLKPAEVQPGDAVRFNRDTLMAFGKIDLTLNESLLLEDIPVMSPALIGGQDENLDLVLTTLRAALLDPALASRYGVNGRNTIIMTGPPGCGKTLLARIVASELARLTGRAAGFAVVKPGQLEDPYVGVTQMKIREFFKTVNRAARDKIVVVFCDELEAWGRIRGTGIGHHDDKALTALLTEINGFKDRENVAIISATNRPDLVDPALLDRCSDLRLKIQRPDPAGARAIFKVHLTSSLPFSPNGALARDTRLEVIETAVSLLYAPNADNEICRVRFRDGKERIVAAGELVSGRLIEQITKQARRKAFIRHVDGKGATGITVPDIQEAVAQALERLRSTLTPVNARAYLDDLPTDVDVIAVEPIRRKVKAAHRYYQPAPFIPA